MRTDIRPAFYLLSSIVLIALLGSCDNEPGLIGRELLPSGDDFTVSFDSTELVYGYNTLTDSIRASYKENFLLGGVTDPFFGKSRAEILTTISTSSTSRGFGPNPVLDSVIYFVSWEVRYGEGQLPLRLYLYEFNEILRYDSTYYSNMDMTGKYRQPALGSVEVAVDDSMAKIFITDPVFLDKFLYADDSILTTSGYLQELMYGLYLTTDEPMDEGNVLSINFDDLGNGLYFYYSNDSDVSLSQSYSLTNGVNGRVNMFRHDRTGYPLEEYLKEGSDNDSLLFIQSMAGVVPRIRFPQLKHWMDSMPVAINEARLIMTMADTAYTLQQEKYFPTSIGLYLVQEDGTYAWAYDYLLDADNFGGGYDEQTMSYSFTLKVQMQSILMGDVKNLEMVLVPGNSSETVSRAGIYGWNERDYRKRLRLEITYTLL